jgi:hypothetical protein
MAAGLPTNDISRGMLEKIPHYSIQCSTAVERRISAGFSLPRYVFPSCGTIRYTNPKVVIRCIPEWAQIPH